MNCAVSVVSTSSAFNRTLTTLGIFFVMCSEGVKISASGLNKQQQQRVAAHSHIRSLGLAPDGTALPQGGGMVGQLEAREAAGIIVDLIKARKLAGPF